MILNLKNKTCYNVDIEFNKGEVCLIINGMKTKIKKVECDENGIHLYNEYKNVLFSIFEDKNDHSNSYIYDCNLYVNNNCLLNNDIIEMDIYTSDIRQISKNSNVEYIEI